MRMQLSRLGPIASIDLEIGDLTVLVGPQASGKSVALEMFKLAAEYQAIKKTLIDHGYDPTRSSDEFFSDYLGEGMGLMWTKDTELIFNNKRVTYELIKSSTYSKARHSVFYIPAQRVTSFESGWPKRFHGYDYSTPFIMREFSESLFIYLDRAYAKTEGKLFPHPKNLKSVFKRYLTETVFIGEVRIDKESGSRKRLVLIPAGTTNKIPMSAWSAGQREFTPLLFGLYKMIPGAARDKDPDIDTVIIEEPEMGLHPRAISNFLFVVMELLYRGYHVLLSTHSPNILEILWAFGNLKRKGGDEKAFCKLFGTTYTKALGPLPRECMGKSLKVYYFRPGPMGTTSLDISNLSPWAEIDEASWGGLTEQSERLAEIVAEASADFQG